MNRLSLRQLVRRAPRSIAQIERELEEEIAFHLAAAEARLVADGVEPEHARAQALARFGDVNDIKSRCRHIAMEEHVMLQRLHLALTVTLLLGAIGLGACLVLSARAAAVERQMAQHMRARAEAATAFLTATITASDPTASRQLLVTDVLERAGLQATTIDDPAVVDRIREAIEQARRELDAEGN